MTDSKLEDAIAEANAQLDKHGVVVKGGNKYLMVKDRVIIFRSFFAETWGIDTEVVQADSQRVIVSAKIINDDGLTIGSGLGEEQRGSSGVNSTSALENAETSAIGRALASLGLHGGEYASADEMINAVNNQPRPTATQATPASGDWEDAIVPIGKNKGTRLGDLSEKQRTWYLENFTANENYPDSVAFRKACDECMGVTDAHADNLADEVSEQTADPITDPDLDEDVPF